MSGGRLPAAAATATGRPDAARSALAKALPAAPLLLVLLAACGAGPPEPGRPSPGAEAAGVRPGAGPVDSELPPIPRVVGPLAIEVRYPHALQRIGVRDSNFVFGSVGTADASLEIDGVAVPVEPNGAFLAWLPVPAAGPGDTASYRLVARRAGEADTLRHRVLLPRTPARGEPGRAWIDSASLASVERWALPDEVLELRVRAAPGAAVWLEAGGSPLPFAGLGEDVYRLSIRAGRLLEVACPGGARPGPRAAAPGEREEADDPPADVGPARGDEPPAAGIAPARRPCAADGRTDTLGLVVAAALPGDTVRLGHAYPLRVLDPVRLPVVRLEEAPSPIHGRSGMVVARPRPSGPYRWRFPTGARAAVDGRVGDRLRLRLAPHLDAWVAAEDAELLAPEVPAPEGWASDVRVEPRADRLVVRVGLEVALPVDVERTDERTLALTVFGARGDTDRIAYGAIDPLLEEVAWAQLPGGLYRLTLRLREPVWGWRVAYERGAARTYQGVSGEEVGRGDEPVLRLDVRRPPRLDRDDPLRGRRVAVDPGHPPAGAHGPTGLYEGDANLAVARRLAAMLREAGAAPVLLREDTAAVGLYERTGRAEAAGAELFVSIHANALPDGLRPFGREGTSTYYHHPQSRPLAAAVQRGMLGEMGLRDLGILWGDLAVVRQTWMPAVLAEGAFMMMPRHEAALRDTGFQERYARGVLEGIEAFLKERAEADGG